MVRRGIVWAADSLLIVAFFLLLWLPLAAHHLGWGSNRTLRENRLLAEAPDFRTAPLASLPKKIDAFLQDQFPFRADFVYWHALQKHQRLKIGSEQVLIGKDGWLFYDANHCQSYDYMGQSLLTSEGLARWKEFLERRADYLAGKGIRYLFVIAPNQSTIYPEMLPERIRAYRGTTRREQLTQYLARHSSVQILDLSEPLRSAKRLGAVYYRTDAHWNGRGCHVAIGSICQRLKPWFPAIDWKPLGGAWRLESMAHGESLWYLLGLHPDPLPFEDIMVRQSPSLVQRRDVKIPANWPSVPPDIWCAPRAYENSAAKPRLVMLGDSFTLAGIQGDNLPLTDFFARSVFIINGRDRNPHALLGTLLEQERPDVVIEEVVEWYLAHPPDSNALAPAGESGTLVAKQRSKEHFRLR